MDNIILEYKENQAGLIDERQRDCAAFLVKYITTFNDLKNVPLHVFESFYRLLFFLVNVKAHISCVVYIISGFELPKFELTLTAPDDDKVLELEISLGKHQDDRYYKILVDGTYHAGHTYRQVSELFDIINMYFGNIQDPCYVSAFDNDPVLDDLRKCTYDISYDIYRKAYAYCKSLLEQDIEVMFFYSDTNDPEDWIEVKGAYGNFVLSLLIDEKSTKYAVLHHLEIQSEGYLESSDLLLHLMTHMKTSVTVKALEQEA